MNSEWDIAGLLPQAARRFGDKLAVCQMSGNTDEHYTFKGLLDAAAALADILHETGIRRGDRVAILSEPRPRWVLAFFAVIRCGAIVLPLDHRLTTAELSSILEDAVPRMLLVSGSISATALALVAKHTVVECVWSLEPASMAGPIPALDACTRSQLHEPACYQRDDPAVLTYTSGTMGVAKGVVTTSGNLMYEVGAMQRVMGNDEAVRCVSILPLSHLYELTSGMLLVLHGGGRVCYVNSIMPHEIIAAMHQQKVTCMVTVPLFLKLLRNGMLKELEKEAAWRQIMFEVLFRVAEYLPRRSRRFLFGPVHRKLGGHLDYFTCGGAPLEAAVESFFTRLGIVICQGYGMAEASPVISGAGPEMARPGTVGKPFPGLEVQIVVNESGRGEILTRGPHVMQGYFNRPELSREMVDPEGWLHTGDIGSLDRAGYLSIHGRMKSLIVMGSGKKVHPEELEEFIFDHADIAEGCVLGTQSTGGITAGTEEVCAVVVPSEQLLSRLGPAQIEQHLRELVARQSGILSAWKRPTRVLVYWQPLPRTSTRKVKRPQVKCWAEAAETVF